MKAPHISGYSPIPVASLAPQTLLIKGSNFSPSIHVLINGIEAGVVSVVTGTQFKWTAVLANSGAVTIIAVNPGGKASNKFVVTIQAATPIPPIPIPPTPSPVPGSLIQSSNLHYIGAFRVPQGTTGDPRALGFSFAGAPIAFNPANNSLFLGGYGGQILAEINIPTPIYSPSLPTLQTASFIQPFSDPSEGAFNPSGTDGLTPNSMGGLLVINGKLYISGYIYYDANGAMTVSQSARSLTLSEKSFTGWQPVGPQQGLVNCALSAIPISWQTLLGGKALASGWGLPIISRESSGPNAIAYDPSLIDGTTLTVPTTPLVNYPMDHPTLGEWGNTAVANPKFNMASYGDGMIIVSGYNSLLHFGRTGLGIPAYGVATDNPALVGTPVPGFPGEVYCYDPVDPSKGNHAYPYTYFVWAYDLNDLAAVKAGLKLPYEVVPYATWNLTLPFPEPSFKNLAATVDVVNGLIYVSQLRADAGDYGYFAGPVIHVFSIVS